MSLQTKLPASYFIFSQGQPAHTNMVFYWRAVVGLNMVSLIQFSGPQINPATTTGNRGADTFSRCWILFTPSLLLIQEDNWETVNGSQLSPLSLNCCNPSSYCRCVFNPNLLSYSVPVWSLSNVSLAPVSFPWLMCWNKVLHFGRNRPKLSGQSKLQSSALLKDTTVLISEWSEKPDNSSSNMFVLCRIQSHERISERNEA